MSLTPAPRRAARPVPVVASLAGVALVAAATLGPAQAAPPAVGQAVDAASPTTGALSLERIGGVSAGAFDESAAEIVAFDPASQRSFTANAAAGQVDVSDLSDPAAPRLIASLPAPGVTGVAVKDGLVAVGRAAAVRTDPGTVAFFAAADGRSLGEVTVGALPDAVTFDPRGKRIVVACEGEPEGYLPGQVDPAGSVAVIDVPPRGAPDQSNVRLADFTAWDGREDELRADGVRIFGPGSSASQDLEPELAAIDRTGRTAWVTLQENNALAVVDLRRAEVTDIVPLGTKDHSVPGQGLDASDRDGGVNIATWPVRGMYLPDGVASYSARGRTYLVTANEGDAREYDGFAEETRVEDLELSPEVFGDAAARAQLQAPENLGRLTVTTTGPVDAQGRATELQAYGSRSLTVWDADGRLVADTGDELERLTAQLLPEAFNSDNAENDSLENRSDNKGPEPENLAIGTIGRRTYAFLGLERVGGVVIYDITDPTTPTYVTYSNPRDFTGDLEANGTDSGPEGIAFVPASDSPDGTPLLLVGNEVSGTTAVHRIAVAD